MTGGATAEDFAFGGRLSLDLTWTLRYRNVLPTETLTSGEAFRDWLALAGLPAPGTATAPQLARAIALREAIYRAALAVGTGGAPAAVDIEYVNDTAAQPGLYVQYEDGRAALRAPDGDGIGAALSTIARNAVEVLAAGDGRLRLCAGDLCSLVFYDSSRPGTRRWCSAERCGNRASTRAHRARRQRA